MPLAMSDAESAPCDQSGDLDLGRGERLPAGGRTLPAPAAGAAPDAVGASRPLGPTDVPPGLQAVVEAGCLVQGGSGFIFPAATGGSRFASSGPARPTSGWRAGFPH